MTRYSPISIPEYTVDKEPDYAAIGSKINAELLTLFLGRAIVLRCLSSQEHKIPREELIKKIMEQGTDKTDPTIRGRGSQNVDCDFFAGHVNVAPEHRMSETWLRKAYQLPIEHGIRPLRQDIFLAYDPEQVELVRYLRDGKPMKDAFKFRHPERKQTALEAVIMIE